MVETNICHSVDAQVLVFFTVAEEPGTKYALPSPVEAMVYVLVNADPSTETPALQFMVTMMSMWPS